MTLQEALDEFDRMTAEIKETKPLTPQQIEALQAQARERPEIKELEAEIKQLKIADAILTRNREK